MIASRLLALVLSPVLARQGRRVRQRTPLLPEAAGERGGEAGADLDGQPLRLLVVGESTAAGVGVAHQDEGLAHRFATELAERRGAPVA